VRGEYGGGAPWGPSAAAMRSAFFLSWDFLSFLATAIAEIITPMSCRGKQLEGGE
jgi:hypothetical protein